MTNNIFAETNLGAGLIK